MRREKTTAIRYTASASIFIVRGLVLRTFIVLYQLLSHILGLNWAYSLLRCWRSYNYMSVF